MSSKRPFFPLFFKNKDKLKYLSMEQRGELLTALFDYAAGGAIPEVNGIVGFAFEIFREDIDSSMEHYKETCEKNRENGRKGGRPKKNSTVSEKTERFSDGQNENPTKPKKTQKTEERREKSEERSQKEEDRSQKTEGEAEERSQSAHTDADSAMAIRNYFADKVGREPSREFIRSAEQTGLSVGYICAAIDKSTGAKVPEGYATNILRRWAADGVPSSVHPVVISDAPLEPWEEEWLAEYRAMTKEQEDEGHGIGGYSETATVDD